VADNLKVAFAEKIGINFSELKLMGMFSPLFSKGIKRSGGFSG
jgi:hypothetical protein